MSRDKYEPVARAMAVRHGIDPTIYARQIDQESGFNPNAVSRTGAQGIAQIKPEFHPDVNPFDPDAALDYSARWMRELLNEFGNYRYALAAYNWGPGNVGGYTKPNGQVVEPWNGRPDTTRAETRKYLDNILGQGWPEPGVAALPDNWQPEDVRDEFPYSSGRSYDTRGLGAITGVVYHHGASRNPAPNRDAEFKLMREYENLHRTNPEMRAPTIAYHMCIGPSGNVYWVNGLELVTWHAVSGNPSTVGICFLGNFENQQPSDVMLDAAVKARRWVAGQLGREDLPYQGHKDWVNTSCPGNWWPTPGRELLTYERGDDTVLQDRVAELEQENADLREQLDALSLKHGELDKWTGGVTDIMVGAAETLRVAREQDRWTPVHEVENEIRRNFQSDYVPEE